MDSDNLAQGSRDKCDGFGSWVVVDDYDLSFLRSDLRGRADLLMQQARNDGIYDVTAGELATVLARRGRWDERTQALCGDLRGRARERFENVVFGFAIEAARGAMAEGAHIDRLADADGWTGDAAAA